MSYRDFQNRVNRLIDGEIVRFFHDKEKRFYRARIFTGDSCVIVTCRENGRKMTVKWGHGHVSMVEI